MIRQPVASTRVKAVGYDRDREAMEVEFTDGTVFCYHGVSRETYVNLLTAASIGKFFNVHIRDVYDYERV